MRGPSVNKAHENKKSGVSYLEVKPGHSLKFSNLEVKNKKAVFLVLKNICTQEIGFRIRSNNTGAFKVRPFNGVIKYGSSMDVVIQLAEGHTINGQEKFLIQAIPVGHSKLSSGSFNALWKNCNRSKQMEYKIKCLFEEETIVPIQVKALEAVKSPSLTSAAISTITNDTHSKKIQELETSIQELKYWNCLLKIAVLFLILVNLLFFAIYFFNDEMLALAHGITNGFQFFSPGRKVNI